MGFKVPQFFQAPFGMEKVKHGVDHSVDLANHGRQIIEFYHVPSNNNVSFKAFLTEFNDQFSSEWESATTFGRMDPIQTFKRTGRQISIAFDVVAGSLEEARSNMENISLLMMMLYPSYDRTGGATTMKGSPYFKLGFMNLAQGQTVGGRWGNYTNAQRGGLLGTLEGFSYSPNLDAGVYFNSVGGASYPKVVNISTTFTVIHQHTLGWAETGGAIGAFANFPYGTKHPDIRTAAAFEPPKKTEAQEKKQPPDRAKKQLLGGKVVMAPPPPPPDVAGNPLGIDAWKAKPEERLLLDATWRQDKVGREMFDKGPSIYEKAAGITKPKVDPNYVPVWKRKGGKELSPSGIPMDSGRSRGKTKKTKKQSSNLFSTGGRAQ